MNLPASSSLSNLLLSSVSTASQFRVLKEMRYVHLPFKASLYRADQTPPYAYLLNSGLASVVSTTASGISAEIGMIGREGLVGCLHILGPANDPADCFMQTDGAGWQIALGDLASLFEELPDLRKRILEFSQSYSCALSKIACCNRLHDVEPRLARWLIMAQSRLTSRDLPFTHDILGVVLGSSRPTLSLALHRLEKKGIVQSARGHISIQKPEELASLSCDCLQSIQNRMHALYQAPL